MTEPAGKPDSESSMEGPVALRWLLLVRFRPLPVALTLTTIALMVVLAQQIIERFRATHLTSQTHLAEVYISRFLEPLVQDLNRGESPDQVRMAEIAALLDPATRPSNLMAMHIWGTDGRLIYSSTPSLDPGAHDDTDLRRAIAGEDVAEFEEDAAQDEGAPIPAPYFEIYLPIRNVDDGSIRGVGEIYIDATSIVADVRNFERTVILSTGLATVAFLVMLAASAHQSEQLRERLEVERRLALQNADLRTAADEARLDASRANEETLNFVGAELHDGPVQLLSLAALMPAGSPPLAPAPGMTQSSLIRQAVDQLRELSSGLVLPEIEDLDLNEVVELAANRFRALSPTPLQVTCPRTDVQIDLPRRICIYRVIQEGLTNAGRHGTGEEIRLSVETGASVLNIAIVSPHGATVEPESRNPRQQLGLQAMRRRLATFGGTAVLRDVGTATVLQVTLPLASDEGPVGRTESRPPAI